MSKKRNQNFPTYFRQLLCILAFLATFSEFFSTFLHFTQLHMYFSSNYLFHHFRSVAHAKLELSPHSACRARFILDHVLISWQDELLAIRGQFVYISSYNPCLSPSSVRSSSTKLGFRWLFLRLSSTVPWVSARSTSCPPAWLAPASSFYGVCAKFRGLAFFFADF